MKKRIFTILGWALIALAVGGLFILAADLPANGYELRFEEPLSVLQADSLSKAAEYLGLSVRERTGGRPVGWMCGQCRSGRCTFWKS